MRAFATPSATKETTDALAAAQKKFEEAQQQLDDLSDQFQTLSEELDDTIGQIEDVNGQIDDTQELIEEKQEELEEKQGELAHRVSSSYEAGDNRMLALLLSSESFSDQLSKTYYINKVNESDQRAIEEVVQIQEDLKETKAELESQKVELEGLKEQQTAQLQSIKIRTRSGAVMALTRCGDLIAKRDAEILAAAKAEEEARRAAEEAAKQQASGGTTSIPGDGQGSSSAGNLQQLVVAWCKKTPSPGAGLCAWWVSDVFERAGLGNTFHCARTICISNFCTSSKKSNLQVGMIIAVSSHSHTWAGRIYGHVGIYVGDNTVMDNVGYIRSINVDEWISSTAISAPRWGWAVATTSPDMRSFKRVAPRRPLDARFIAEHLGTTKAPQFDGLPAWCVVNLRRTVGVGARCTGRLHRVWMLCG